MNMNLGVGMRVLVAGDPGYIGTVLVPFLRAAGHEVDGLNLGLYEGCDNVQVRDIAEMVRDALPSSTVTLADGAGPDLRNYRVDFPKLAATFPELSLQWSVRDGVGELIAAYTEYGLTYDDFRSSRFVRLRRIRELLAAGQVDEMLRRPPGAAA
jgi:nucleoside-diphosphate-sugar epimerase